MLAALQDVTDCDMLGRWLDVPLSRRQVMSGKESMLEEWLQNHPAPSWKLVAWALYKSGGLTEHNVLKQYYGKHVSGMWLHNRSLIIISGTIPHCVLRECKKMYIVDHLNRPTLCVTCVQ